MARTLPWSKRVGEVWTGPDGYEVEILAEHTIAGMVLVLHGTGLDEWVKGFDEDYRPVSCGECGAVRRAA